MTIATESILYPFAFHVDLRPLGERRCLVMTQTNERYEIDASPDIIADLLARCDGTRTPEQITSDANLREVLDVLLDEGCLLIRKPPQDQLKDFRLHLIGDAELCLLAQTLSTEWGSVFYTKTGATFPPIQEPDKTVVMALMPHIDGDWLASLNQHCLKAGCRWTQLHFDVGKGWLGPFIVPGRTADYEDLIGRRRCSGDDVEGAQMRPPVLPARGPATSVMHWMLATLLHETAQAMLGQPCRLYSTEMEADPVELSLQTHHVLPLPTRAPEPAQWLTSETSPYRSMVDSRTGIILSQHVVDHHPELPKDLRTVRSHCTDLSRIYPWGNDLFVGGSTFGDEGSARGASLGEALERYCGNCLPGVEMVLGSYDELTAGGQQALDPESLILHSPKMLQTPGCPFVPFSRDLPVYWVKGTSLTRSAPCLLPLALVYANWQGGDLKQPITNYLYTPGMAAGQNLERALVGAVRELVERDITMIWWHNALPLPAVKPTSSLEALWHQVPDRESQQVRYLHLDNPFNIPVIVAVVENTRHNFLNIGFGCRPDPEDAAHKALTEALTLQEGSRDLVLQDSTLRMSSEEWNLLNVSYRPWRQDRRYMDDFRDDYRDVNDLMLQQQFYLDPRAIEHVRPWLLDPPETRGFDDLPRLADDTFASYRKPIEAAGFDIHFANITSPDVALTDFRVVRVIIPGLVPNMPAAFPAVGGERVFNLPVTMGRRSTPLKEETLNYFPMPHA